MDSYKSICCTCVEKGSLPKLSVLVNKYQKNIQQKIKISGQSRCSVSIPYNHSFRFICRCVLDQFCCTSGGHSWPNGRLKSNPVVLHYCVREAVKYYLADFCPPNVKSFCQKKTLCKWGVPPLPLNGKSPKISSPKWSKKGQNQRFWTKNTYFLVDFFLSGIGGYPALPLSEKIR